MNSPFRIALNAALLLGGTVVLAPQVSALQSRGAQTPAPQPVRQFRLDKTERAAIAPLQAAIAARNWAAAAAALPAAQAGARSSDARYVAARLQLQLGLETQNRAMQSQAIDAMIASGAAQPAELPALIQNQVAIIAATGNTHRTEIALARLIEVEPANAQALSDLARIKADLRKTSEAVPLFERAIAAREATGQKPPESWYIYALRVASDAKMAPQSARIGRALVAAYPSPENWRDAMLGYIDLSRPGDPAPLDAYRLMRAAKALAGERDYLQFAQAANSAGLAAEAKAVLDEGVSRRMVDPAKTQFRELIATSGRKAAAERSGLGAKQSAAIAAPTGVAALGAGDAYFSYGDYANAATLYRAAAQKGGVDVGLANVRLGAALALAGQRAEAETAFRSVTGPSADLASYWLAWLRQPA